MGYEEWWKTLENLITEFKKKRVPIPNEVMISLKSGKTMLEVYGADLSRVEVIPSIENYLLTVESNLMNLAEEKFGEAFMKRWIRKLGKARKESPTGVTSQRFVPGLPKGKHWIRVLPSDEILKKDVLEIADKIGLSSKMQKDGYILIYGSKEKVKDFVKKMADISRRTRAS